MIPGWLAGWLVGHSSELCMRFVKSLIFCFFKSDFSDFKSLNVWNLSADCVLEFDRIGLRKCDCVRMQYRVGIA